jgi:molybdopterin synthase sulfur carrier subunit
MKVQLKFFSVLREIVGSAERTVDLPVESNPDTILQLLTQQYPPLGKWKPSLRVAVNWTYVEMNHPVQDGDEVAIIPPVSGG